MRTEGMTQALLVYDQDVMSKTPRSTLRAMRKEGEGLWVMVVPPRRTSVEAKLGRSAV